MHLVNRTNQGDLDDLYNEDGIDYKTSEMVTAAKKDAADKPKVWLLHPTTLLNQIGGLVWYMAYKLVYGASITQGEAAH